MNQSKSNKSPLHELEQLRQQYAELKEKYEKIITHKQQKEEAFLQSDAQFDAMFENMASGSCLDEIVYDEGKPVNYRILKINSAFEKILGIKRDKAVGALATEVYNTKEPPLLDIYSEVARTGIPQDLEHYFQPTGQYLHITVGCPKPGFFSTVFADITGRKNIENELKEKTSFLTTIMETSPVGIVTVDKIGNITYANNRAEQILGLKKKQITSTSYDAPLWNHTDLDGSPLPDEKQPFNIIKKSLKTALNIQHGITCPDGTVVILSINASPLKGHNGEFNGMIASIEDITEYKLAEKELILSEKHNVFLAQTASDLVEFSSIQEIYKYTVHKLYELFKGNSVVALVEYDYSTNRWKMKQVEGIGKKAAELSRLLGVNINNLEGDISVKYYEQITSGKVAELEFDLTGLFNRKLSAAVGSAVKKMFSVEKMYCIAFEQDKQIIGNITFTTNKKSEPINKKLIETFVKQVSTIIKKQKAEERLKESENFYKVTFEEAAVGIAHVLPNGHFLKGNKKFCDIIGYDAAELTEMNIIDISFAEDFEEENKYISQVLSNKIDSYIIEKRYRHKQGHQIWVRLHSNVVKNKHGEIEFAVASISDITERIQVELTLKQSELQNRTILQTALDGFWIVDTEGRFTEVNNAYCQLTGYSREELLTMSITDVEVLESEAMVYQRIQRLLQNGSDRFESKHRCKDGRILEVEVSVNLLKNDKKIFVFMHDITEQKLAEESLKISKERFKAIANYSASWEAWFNNQGRLVWTNSYCEKITGYTTEEYLSADNFLKMAVSETDLSKAQNTLIDGLTGTSGENLEIRCKHKKGNEVWISISWKPIYDNDGSNIGVRTSSSDITERKKAELLILNKTEEIGFHNQRLESLLRISQYQTHSIQELLDLALSEAIALTKSKIGYIYFYNETNEQFVLNTWSKDVMQECRVMNPQTIYDLDKTGCWGEAVRQRKPIIINDYQADNSIKKGTPHGHVKLQKFLTIPVFSDSEIVAVAGVANKETDYDNSDVRQLTLLMDSVWKISERILLIKDLTIAKEKAEESDRLKSAFLANMSHEIRTPMNGILGFTDLLLNPDLNSEEKKAFIKIVHQSGQRMLNTVDDIVEISKIEAGLVNVIEKETDINESVEELTRFFQLEAEKKGLSLILGKLLPVEHKKLMTDQTKLDSILTNLIKNAIKYTDSGIINVGCSQKGTEIEFYIKDTGIGIPTHGREAVFNRFEQADIEDKRAFQGSGLGLAISKSYIEMLGGKIWVESEEGKGSTFYFTLPVKSNLEEKLLSD